MLNWVNRFNIFCFLDNRQYQQGETAFECLLAAGTTQRIQTKAGNAFEELQNFYTKNGNEWLFGHFGYDLKNETENLCSGNDDGIGFSDLHFFVPEIVVELKSKIVNIYCEADAGKIYWEILSSSTVIPEPGGFKVKIQNKISREQYQEIIGKLRQHILRGDCYEINFCQEFFAPYVDVDPLQLYHKLTHLSPNPFSVLYKVDQLYCLCASPERYLKRAGERIYSQPIKGTTKRILQDEAADEVSKNNLLASSKERSENVMIVDLVRNDLSRICKPGSVKVDELFGIYSFPQVHQMISTVSGEPEPGLNWIDCIKATFPMGSMTGAPKKKVMELIEQYEETKRGLFSGAIGYVKPGEDLLNGQAGFDFNVVIRSILYNATSKYLSFQTGGAITYNSDPFKEYEECLLKAEAIMKVLE
jgi:para-aminobenzoate synthetase component 1